MIRGSQFLRNTHIRKRWLWRAENNSAPLGNDTVAHFSGLRARCAWNIWNQHSCWIFLSWCCGLLFCVWSPMNTQSGWLQLSMTNCGKDELKINCWSLWQGAVELSREIAFRKAHCGSMLRPSIINSRSKTCTIQYARHCISGMCICFYWIAGIVAAQKTIPEPLFLRFSRTLLQWIFLAPRMLWKCGRCMAVWKPYMFSWFLDCWIQRSATSDMCNLENVCIHDAYCCRASS